MVAFALAAFAEATTGDHVPATALLPMSAATEVSRPLPVPTFWARRIWPEGRPQPVFFDDLSTQ